MADERTKKAMDWIADAMGSGFAGEESFRVNEKGEIVIWLNDQTEGYTRLRFVLADIWTVPPEQFQREYLGAESGSTSSVGELYIARMRELARGESKANRFYIFLNDQKIYDWDQEGEPPYDMLFNLYSEWLGEMTREERKELWETNLAWNSANQNFMIYDLLDERGNILDRDGRPLPDPV